MPPHTRAHAPRARRPTPAPPPKPLQGYEKLLRVLGSNVAEFLSNLNNLHLHLTMGWPVMIAPAFRCEEVRAPNKPPTPPPPPPQPPHSWWQPGWLPPASRQPTATRPTQLPWWCKGAAADGSNAGRRRAGGRRRWQAARIVARHATGAPRALLCRAGHIRVAAAALLQQPAGAVAHRGGRAQRHQQELLWL